MTISSQATAFSQTVTERTVADVLEHIGSDRNRVPIVRLRDLLAEGKKKEYTDRKKLLEGVTFAGSFREHRVLNNLENYNALCVIDIDGLDKAEVSRLRQSLEADQYVLATWLSPSAAGIKGLVHFEYDRKLTLETAGRVHSRAFHVLCQYFLDTHNAVLDDSGSDVTRLCFLSWDKNIHVKKIFAPYEITIDDSWLLPEKHAQKKQVIKTGKLYAAKVFDDRPFLNGRGKNRPRDRHFMQRTLRYLEKRNLSITSTYPRWSRIAFAIANTFTFTLGKEFFLRLCRLDGDNHDEQKSEDLIKYCYETTKGMATIGTIRWYLDRTKEQRGELYRRIDVREGIH